jgi:hypothetical protein
VDGKYVGKSQWIYGRFTKRIYRIISLSDLLFQNTEISDIPGKHIIMSKIKDGCRTIPEAHLLVLFTKDVPIQE